MSIRKKVWFTFLGIIILTLLAALIDYPKGPDIKIGKIQKELKIHLGLDLQGGAHLVYGADVSGISPQDRSAALESVRDVIERRVNAFGVSEPVVQTNRVGDSYRVVVELAGVFDIDEAIEMIGETPILEFKEQKGQPEISEEEKKQIEEYNTQAKEKAQDILNKLLKEESDFSQLVKEYSEDELTKDKEGNLGFISEGRVLSEIEEKVKDLNPGQVYPEVIESFLGYHIVKVTDKKDDDLKLAHILIKKKEESFSSPFDLSQYQSTGLSGQHLKRAQVQFNSSTGAPEVGLEFNEEGKKLFAEITKRNVGKIVAIFLDGVPISLPRVNEPILNGKAVITGNFTLQEAKQLARRLNTGALPVPITLISQQTVGASLGKLSVQKSFLAGIIGLVLVVLFMISYYRFLGLIASAALGIYGLLILAIFKLWPIVLTLAGVAGFILSIGMAVDANVLIFERIKEELRSGKPLSMSIEDGFKRAWPSIRDSNVSSLITCLILIWFGTSLIKGFAITLGIGILVSMFSAITLTRNFLRIFSFTPLARFKRLLGF